MNKGRFLNQKLGKRASRKIALLKSSLATRKPRIQDSGFRIQGGKQDSAFRASNKTDSQALKQT
jgi:hypothetical protein